MTRIVTQVPGVQRVTPDVPQTAITVRFDGRRAKESQIIEALRAGGYDVEGPSH